MGSLKERIDHILFGENAGDPSNTWGHRIGVVLILILFGLVILIGVMIRA